MARAGDVLVNSATGERIVFRRTAQETGGALLEMDDFWMRPDHRTPEHVHPAMAERWTVVEGVAGFRIGGVESRVEAGDSVSAPPGVPHMAWNAGDGPVHLRIQLRPALRWEEFVERLFALANDGSPDAAGTSDPSRMAALMREFQQEIAPGT